VGCTIKWIFSRITEVLKSYWRVCMKLEKEEIYLAITFLIIVPAFVYLSLQYTLN